MPKYYDTREMINLAEATGFVSSNKEGNHCKFQCKTTDISTTIPVFNDGVSVGVGENIVKMAYLREYVTNEQLLTGNNNFSENIQEVIYKHHQKVQENKTKLIPNFYAKSLKIETEAQVDAYINQLKAKHHERTSGMSLNR